MKITFSNPRTGVDKVRQKCVIERGDGFSAIAYGDTQAQALLRASVLIYNRECQEFNADECAKQDRDRKDYSKPSEQRYVAKRREPVAILTTGAMLEIAMFCDGVKIVNKQVSRSIEDNEQMLKMLKTKIDEVPFECEAHCREGECRYQGEWSYYAGGTCSHAERGASVGCWCNNTEAQVDAVRNLKHRLELFLASKMRSSISPNKIKHLVGKNFFSFGH